MDSFTQVEFGVSGAKGRNWGPPGAGAGEAGGNGQRGEAIRLGFDGVLAAGPADTALLELFAYGGLGGLGGMGQAGADGTRSVIRDMTELGPRETVVFGPGAEGGRGGTAGLGGMASAISTGAEFSGGATSISLAAHGGQGGAGGGGGIGGYGGFRFDGQDESPDGILVFAAIPDLAGLAGASGAGQAGGLARTGLNQALVTGGVVSISLESYGGWGGAGGGPPLVGGLGAGASNLGAVPATGPAGARGGNGGAAVADVLGLRVVGATVLTLELLAFGGEGDAGGWGGAGTASFEDEYNTATDAEGDVTIVSQHYLSTYGDGGNGGDGGTGGNALARLVNADITMTEGSNVVVITLVAEAGWGGEGGEGGLGVPSGSGDGWTDIGSDPGAPGQTGADGSARLIMARNSIALGGDNDLLSVSLYTESAQVEVRFGGNRFDGGEGTDTISLAGSSWGASFDVHAGRVSLRDVGGSNVMTGFEAFEGTDQADLFRDGAGSHVYTGLGGPDRFTFGRTHGQDLLLDFGADDVIEFLGFGPRLGSFEDVLARAHEDGADLVLDTGFGGTLVLAGVSHAALQADQFLFS